MLKKKISGFTLIELLAVIVILAVIMLIATPTVMEVIDDAKKATFKNSAHGIVKSAVYNHSLNIISGKKTGEITYTYNNGVETSEPDGHVLDYSGNKPKNGSVIVNSDGDVKLALHDGTYCAEKAYEDSEITITTKTLEECKRSMEYVDNTGAAIPEFGEGMIPIRWDEKITDEIKWVKADINEEWYDYDKQEWANVVLVNKDNRDDYKIATPGTPINEEHVMAYLVWIPRYRYELFNVNSVGNTEEIEIPIIFEDKNQTKSTGKNEDGDYKNGEWLTHPAFTFGSEELNGFWVGKFETTSKIPDDATTPTIKPGIASLRSQNIRTQFETAQKFNTQSTYGLPLTLDAHMMKNMEWGAVTYLSHSKYGKFGNSIYTGVNKEIYQNKSGSYITGSSNGTPSQSSTNTQQCAYTDIVDRENGIGACGAGASTTGNIYGIYDMSGGAYEYVMGGMYSDETKTKLLQGSAEFTKTELTLTSEDFIGSKYIDKYTYGTSYVDYSRRKLGDATGETRGWYGDFPDFVYSGSPWFARGGSCNDGTNAGAFNFISYNGDLGSVFGFRLAVSGVFPSA
ncbi:MAG: type II secretion system protein [Bacilli bacterium]|nr:type II secretion system protein [Bacilli bacterium]